MRFLQTYLEHLNQAGDSLQNHPNVYQVDWKNIVPDSLVVIKGGITDLNGYVLKDGKPTDQLCLYKLGNLMSDLVYQITYDRQFDAQGIPDTLEMDVAIIKDENDGRFEMDVEITFGDLIAAGFRIEAPDKLTLYQYTSYHSKNDPSNTVFAFDEESLKKLMDFFNKFDSIELDRHDLNFLDNDPNSYYP